MPEEMTVIIHGWSDCSDSFRGMKDYLVRKGIGSVDTILYGDYESREDNITFNDVIDGLNDEFIRHGIIDPTGRKKKDLNVIVHSTGGLVIRHWIWRYYYRDGNRLDECPVKRLVMLAPANFGSPLAHRGKSFLGSLVKGRWKIGDFLEVGRQLLDGLELASPYQWELAHRDLVIQAPYYNAEQIQTTILVGVEDYRGLRGWVNKPGTDGTVVIAGTSLDSAKLVLDFSKPTIKGEAYNPFEWSLTDPPDEFGFGVLEKLDHGSIVGDVGSHRDNQVSRLVLKALTTEDESDFREFSAQLDDLTAATYRKTGKPRYQQFLLHALDDQDAAITDFTVEFFLLHRDRSISKHLVRRDLTSKEQDWTRKVNEVLLGEIHTHSKDPSFRRLLVDVDAVRRLLRQAQKDLGEDLVLSMRVYVPRVDKGIYYNIDRLQNIVLYDAAEQQDRFALFYENTTTLVELRVDRANTYVTVGTRARKR